MKTGAYLESVLLKREQVPGFDAYPFSLPVVRALDVLEFHPAVTFVIGENGTGKSTLVEAIAVASGFNAEGGSRSLSFSTRASHSCLHEYLRLRRGSGRGRPRDGYFLRAESYHNVATAIEAIDREIGESWQYGPPIIDAYGGVGLHEQSHGESFLALFLNRLRGDGLYLLDEPEAALSPTRQLAVLRRVHDLVRDGSQFIVATHSPILLAYPDAWIYELSDEGIQRMEYRETEHYLTTKSFLNDPDVFLDELFRD
ncbi:MAG: AAA family ATPase [Planctomycetota bacterium]